MKLKTSLIDMLLNWIFGDWKAGIHVICHTMRKILMEFSHISWSLGLMERKIPVQKNSEGTIFADSHFKTLNFGWFLVLKWSAGAREIKADNK